MSKVELWKGDQLGRSSDAEFIFDFLIGRLAENSEHGRGSGYVLNLDAGWGSGKSFFLERFGEQLEAEGYLVARVNAWRDDFAPDPFVAVLEAIEASVGKFTEKPTLKNHLSALKKEGGPLLKEIGKGLVLAAGKRLLAEGADAIADTLSGNISGDLDDRVLADGTAGAADGAMSAIQKLTDRSIDEAISEFRKAKSSVDTFRVRLEALVEAVGQSGQLTPLFVLVDELDRCRPGFAISMLERIKHLFQAKGVVFIIATDTAQLEHSVRAIYGEGLDAGLYLSRFFDRTYTFDEPDLARLIADLIERFPLDTAKVSYYCKADQPSALPIFLTSTCAYFRVNPREASKCYDLLRTIVTLWNKNTPLELDVLMPLVIGQIRRSPLTLDGASLVTSALAGREAGNTGFEVSAREGRKQRIDASSAFSAFVAIAQRRLRDTYNNENTPSDRFQGYIKNQLDREFERRQSEGSEIFSYVLSYPSLVRKAGRFAN